MANEFKKLFKLLPLASLLVVSACTDSKVAGGTEAESTIAVQIQLADGSPAARTRVRMLSENYLPDGMTEVDWSVADDEGRAEFKNVSAGSYVVEARRTLDDEAVGAVAYVTLDSGNAVIDSMELSTLATIDGYVVPGQGPSVVRIPGLERFVVPDSAGHFVIDSLPAGNFEVVIESRSNRGTIKVSAASGDTVPEVSLGAPRGFAVEDFESFSGISATGAILGDGWWYTLDADGKNLMPLWDKSLTQAFAGHQGCASGGCARIYGSSSAESKSRLGFLLGGYNVNYELSELDSIMFSARGVGKLHISLDAVDSSASVVSSLEFDVELSKVWQGFSLPVDMDSLAGLNRIDFSVPDGDTVYLDDVFLGGVTEENLGKVATDTSILASVYPTSWEEHSALLKEVSGYAVGVRGGEGYIDSLAADTIQGEICIVTTTDDYVIVEDTTNLDSAGNATTKAVIATGSLRDCAYRSGPTWILFEKSGTYNLSSPLRIKSNKTFDGRGRDVRITGMGVLTDQSSNLIFENLTFTDPAITVRDTTSHRAISVHNASHHVWIDHCTFESYPLVEVDVKRGSYGVTISWCRFENADTGILFGLQPEMIDESAQTLTLHHNFFNGLEWSGAFARQGSFHAYNNFFFDVGQYGVECTDSARCYMERNIFNKEEVVSLYRLWDDDVPVDTTIGFVKMKDDWFTAGGEELEGDADGYEPAYDYESEEADGGLAWKIKQQAGPR